MRRRIVSLVPSLTETVVSLGIGDELVGITKFCVEPPGLHRTAALVGGTKDPELEAIFALKPTHVFVNEEENKPEHIAELARRVPTLNTFPKGPADVPGMLREMAAFLGAGAAAEELARAIEAELERAEGTQVGRRALYYIWREPYMVVAEDTYISAMMKALGYENAVKDAATRYPELTVAAAKALRPDVIFLSTEPYPFRKRDVERLQGEWADEKAPPILKADGRLFSWYGSATLAALREPEALIQPF